MHFAPAQEKAAGAIQRVVGGSFLQPAHVYLYYLYSLLDYPIACNAKAALGSFLCHRQQHHT